MMPDLSRWPEADRVLDAALALPAAERLAYVRRTVSDAELIRALEAVLAEAENDDDFLRPSGAWSGPLARELREKMSDAPPRLAAGNMVEHYEVLAPIGHGGMGEVYRARDTRLARDVALKVLPPIYASDPERQARFTREARVLATLNHPGIAAIYGVAESDGVEALVLELVEGPTLAEVLRDGPMAIEDVVTIAMQIVDALAAAHALGILHRDLKPANIKVSRPSTVKVLDFGLARVLGGDDDRGLAADLTHHSGEVLLGTASYMSPEQARGRPVDQRADIWAFGCVLFEMLTGVRAFAGESATDVLAAVIKREPAYSLLPPATPQAIRRLLRRCLEKDPERRLAAIADARLDLEEVSDEPLLASDEAPRTGSWWRYAALGAAVIVAAGGAAVWMGLDRSAPSAVVSRLVMPLPAGDQPVAGFQPALTVSPDGRTLVYRARRGDVTQLFRRDLAALEASPIDATIDATGPFFSPDGRWLGFDADGVLKRVSMNGGTPVVICDAPGGATATWLPDDTIVFGTNTTRVLQRVAASGGTPQPITTLDLERGDTLHLLPHALPGGNAVLFTIVAGASRFVAVLDLASGEVQVITEGASAQLLGDDLLVFARDGALWAAPFDVDRRALAGTAMPLSERVEYTDNTVFHFAATDAGTLAYLPPQSSATRQRLAWIDRAGRETPVNVEPRPYVRLGLSPDGQRIALALDEGGNTDVWIADPERQTMSRLTFEPAIDTMPTWSPDGRSVAFRSERERPGVFRRDAQGTGVSERLSETDGPIHSPYSWTPDGRTLLVAIFRSFRSQAIGSVTPPDTRVRVLLDGDFAQLDPQVSPDGRWMAYQSDETGRFEVYVRPYPDVEAGRWVVSTSGGTSPRWSPDGRELFYYDGEAVVRVAVRPGATFSAGRPEPLLKVRPFGGRLGPDFEVSPDGQRFLFLLPAPPTASPQATGVVIVQHFIEELRARLVGR